MGDLQAKKPEGEEGIPSQAKNTKPPQGPKRSRPSKEELDVEEIGLMRQIAAAMAEPTTTVHDDVDDLFGKYIAKELKEITDEKSKLVLKNEIQNLIFRARMEAVGMTPFQQVPQTQPPSYVPQVHQTMSYTDFLHEPAAHTGQYYDMQTGQNESEIASVPHPNPEKQLFQL